MDKPLWRSVAISLTPARSIRGWSNIAGRPKLAESQTTIAAKSASMSLDYPLGMSVSVSRVTREKRKNGAEALTTGRTFHCMMFRLSDSTNVQIRTAAMTNHNFATSRTARLGLHDGFMAFVIAACTKVMSGFAVLHALLECISGHAVTDFG
jgi:hypothetical protein